MIYQLFKCKDGKNHEVESAYGFKFILAFIRVLKPQWIKRIA